MDDNSDAGAVAARAGFRFQDHVAAMFVIDMIGDRRIVQVECETSDDITIKWRFGAKLASEYVQVKTTDRDSKWTLKEITARAIRSNPTSLIEKSLLADRHEEDARFRIVARRAVGKALLPLVDQISARDSRGAISSLARQLKSRFPKTVSENGHDLDYWARNTFWQVISGSEPLQFMNLQAISRNAEEQGANPTHSHVKEIYRDLLEKVEDAARASRRNPPDKIITREAALEWWGGHLSRTRAAQNKTSKPYRVTGERFFAEVHSISEEALNRFGTGYDAEYERQIWRSRPLARYLATWIPEVVLKASELVDITQLNLRQKIDSALRVLRAERDLGIERILGEALLHAILRHWFKSEPIACKLFQRSVLGDRVVGSAHIVHQAFGDQLWLGRVHFFRDGDLDALTASIRLALAEALSSELLSEEREIILQLREPQHLTANNLDGALQRGAPIDELIKVLCLPLLLVYDSEVLALGHSEDYKYQLKGEIEDIYQFLKSRFPAELKEVRVHVFLVPVESLSRLESDFAEELGLA